MRQIILKRHGCREKMSIFFFLALLWIKANSNNVQFRNKKYCDCYKYEYRFPLLVSE